MEWAVTSNGTKRPNKSRIAGADTCIVYVQYLAESRIVDGMKQRSKS